MLFFNHLNHYIKLCSYTDVNKINTIFAWRMTYEAESSYQMVLFSFLFFFGTF